jgi:hypothetical protein
MIEGDEEQELAEDIVVVQEVIGLLRDNGRVIG